MSRQLLAPYPDGITPQPEKIANYCYLWATIDTHMKTNTTAFFRALLGFMLLLHACAPSKTITTQKANTYEENVSQYRINYADSLRQDEVASTSPERTLSSGPITTRYAITGEMDDYLAERSEVNREKNAYQGFTLQVYTGGSREEANAAKRRVYSALPNARPNIHYNSSIYRVQVGEYVDRLQAQEDYTMLKKEFPYVLLVPQRFKVN